MSLSESQVITKVIRDKDYSILTSNFLDESYFFADYDAYIYLRDYYAKYKSTPTAEQLIQACPNFAFADPPSNFKSALDEIREQRLFNRCVKLIQDSGQKMEKNSNDGVRYLLAHLDELRLTDTIHMTDLIHDSTRLREWEDKKKNPTSYFIGSGFPELDKYMYGWNRKEEFALMMARSGVGKTMFLIKSAQASLEQGYTVVFYSPEMSVNTLGYRFDSAMAGFSNSSLMKGCPLSGDYANYIRDLENSNKHFYVVESKDFKFGGDDAVTVPKLRDMCNQVNADILFIDGFDYLEDSRRRRTDSREDCLGHIAKDLITMSVEMSIPVVAAIQANRNGTDDTKELGTEHITGADKIGASCTRLIAMRNVGGAMQITLPKNRYGVHSSQNNGVKVLYAWEADIGKFTYIPNLEDIEKDKDLKDNIKDSVKNVF